jgi:hypothetical protein
MKIITFKILLVTALLFGAVWFYSDKIDATPRAGSAKAAAVAGKPGDFQHLDESTKSGGAYNTSSSPAAWIKDATKDWMKGVPDSTLVKNLSLPGTHDSAARFGGAAAQAQTWTIDDQLAAGIRYFDIRTRTMQNALAIHHGDFYQNQNFGDVMKTVTDFLRDHPSEVVVIRVKKDEDTPGPGTTEGDDKTPSTFKTHWNAEMKRYSSYVAGGDTGDASLGQMRGKILFLREGFDSPRGIYYNESITDAAGQKTYSFDIQDYYKVYFLAGDGFSGDAANLPGKKKVINQYFDRAVSSSKWVLNHLSGSTGMIPSDVARATNNTAYDYLGLDGGTRKLGVVIMDFPGEQLVYRIIKSNFKVNGTGFLLQVGTALPEGGNFVFRLATNGDLFAIKKSGTGSGKTEVHVLSAASNYKTFILQTATSLGETGATADFVLAENRDLFAIQKSGTGTRSTEVHILSAASNYKSFVLQTGTALGETGATTEFALAANRDLFAIMKSGTGSRTTEVHVLSAAGNYKSFVLQTKTGLHETGTTTEFALAANRDLFAIMKSGTGTRSTEVHVLSAASSYKSFIFQSGTVLAETDSGFSFAVTSTRKLFAVKKQNTGSKSTEVHIVDLR